MSVGVPSQKIRQRICSGISRHDAGEVGLELLQLVLLQASIGKQQLLQVVLLEPLCC